MDSNKVFVYLITGPVSIREFECLSKDSNPAVWGMCILEKEGTVRFGEESPEMLLELSLQEMKESAQEEFPDYGYEELFFFYALDVESETLMWRLETIEKIKILEKIAMSNMYH